MLYTLKFDLSILALLTYFVDDRIGFFTFHIIYILLWTTMYFFANIRTFFIKTTQPNQFNQFNQLNHKIQTYFKTLFCFFGIGLSTVLSLQNAHAALTPTATIAASSVNSNSNSNSNANINANVNTSTQNNTKPTIIESLSPRAANIELQQLLQQYKAFTAEVVQTQIKSPQTQTTYDRNKNPAISALAAQSKISSKTAHLTFLMPDYFVWAYQFPQKQKIVSDGTHVYLYEPALKQLIEKDAKQVLKNAPLNVLFNQKLSGLFNVQIAQPSKALLQLVQQAVPEMTQGINNPKNIRWFELIAKTKDNMYQSIYLAFDGDVRAQQTIRYIVFNTVLGQTVIAFKGFAKANLKASDFLIDKHVDVSSIRER